MAIDRGACQTIMDQMARQSEENAPVPIPYVKVLFCLLFACLFFPLCLFLFVCLFVCFSFLREQITPMKNLVSIVVKYAKKKKL